MTSWIAGKILLKVYHASKKCAIQVSHHDKTFRGDNSKMLEHLSRISLTFALVSTRKVTDRSVS